MGGLKNSISWEAAMTWDALVFSHDAVSFDFKN